MKDLSDMDPALIRRIQDLFDKYGPKGVKEATDLMMEELLKRQVLKIIKGSTKV